MDERIRTVVFEFYKLATTDVMIGYHFRKIQEHSGSHPLLPPIDAFAKHLPRIEHFWEVQLLGAKANERFDLIEVHRRLSIRQGELSRWVLLFKQTLDRYDDGSDFYREWREKVLHFESIFRRQIFG